MKNDIPSINTHSAACPHCKNILDGFTCMTDGTSLKEEDIVICVECNSVLQFKSDLTLHYADPEIIAEVDFPLLQQSNEVIAAIHKVREELNIEL